MDCSTPGFPVHHQLPELAQTHVHRAGDAIQPSDPLSSPLLLPSMFPSIRVFSTESVLHIRWPKYWSFRFSISPSNEYSGLISFRIYWLDLLAVQATLKSLLLHHSSKASILQHSAFFSIQLSHLHMTTGKTLRVLDSKGYHNKIPKQGGPNHSHLLSHSSGGWKSKFKMLAVLISLEVLLPGLQKLPFLLCLHMDFLCVCISLFMKGPSDTYAVPYLGPF